MRPEIYEYNYDWMLWRTCVAAANLGNGSDYEVKKMLDYVPYFRGIIEPVMNLGETGKSFLRMMAEYTENIVCAKKQGKKVALTTFCFSPTLLYAMDIVPISLEPMTVLGSVLWKRGCTDYMDYCSDLGFSETGCSSQRGSMGAYLAGLGAEIDLVVIDSAGVCDTNANAFAFAASYLKKPFYCLNYPAGLTDDRSKNYHREDYRALIAFLEKLTGKSFKEDKLRKVLEEYRKQDLIISELEELQRFVPSPFPVVYNFLIYAGRFFFAGKESYTKLLKDMLDVVKDNAKKGRSGISSGIEKCRAFFFYIDHYALDLKLWDWLDKNQINHMGNILSRAFGDTATYTKGMEEATYHIDTRDMDHMIDTLAEINARMPMVRSIRGPYDMPNMWLEESIAMAKMYKADCCVYNGTPGCRNTWSNVKLIANDLEKYGYPTHIMYGDAFDDRVESWEATAARLDEFFKIRGLL
ncbi:MAG: 2-hydroxyacyl-CoA dehydratase [Desulfobacterales bacterium]|nr:2-hydroxyacyl-CoA dehydratase [Desulfobacterales bacterium]MBF0397153.1 2-hydroxyacyl-CoA dehydratase [Desulfobacterales bacterium]